MCPAVVPILSLYEKNTLQRIMIHIVREEIVFPNIKQILLSFEGGELDVSHNQTWSPRASLPEPFLLG